MENQKENQKDQQEKTSDKPSCIKCGSKFIYIRIKDQQKVCRQCGNIEDIK